MCALVVRVLVAGPIHSATRAVLNRLVKHGWGFHAVDSLREANTVLGTFQYDLVLASEFLPDGRGYDLMSNLQRRGASLLVGIELSESCLWLPVLDHGKKTLGSRALNARLLESEMEAILRVEVTDAAAIQPARAEGESPAASGALPAREKKSSATAH
ncbi:MAG TPA: hypothetical protein VIC00_06720 [Candidatus Acidoferrales bacterium]|jgi:hypothetical protein